MSLQWFGGGGGGGGGGYVHSLVTFLMAGE